MTQAPCPSDRIPDFCIVGAPKCATSSLHAFLRRHPGLFMCTPKEPHFYATDLPGLAEVPGAGAYRALFDAAPPDALRGEASAFYLASTEAAANLRDANPEMRIVLSIRHPADASVSWYHQLRDGFREDQTTFAASWDLQDARAAGKHLPPYCPEPRQLLYRDIYTYHDQILRYFEAFGRDRVKVIHFDRIKADPGGVAAETLEFLGLPPFETPVEISKSNARREPVLPGLTQFLAAPPRALRPLVGPVKRGLNRLGIKPSDLVMKHLSRPATTTRAPEMSPDLRARVTAAFAEDIARLEALLGWDLSDWTV